MNKCNVPKKKIIVVSKNIFLQETGVLRKIVVQAKTLLLVIALFTVAMLSRLYIAIGKKEDVDLLFLLIFRRSPPSEVI